jgi:hypothetical protein
MQAKKQERRIRVKKVCTSTTAMLFTTTIYQYHVTHHYYIPVPCNSLLCYSPPCLYTPVISLNHFDTVGKNGDAKDASSAALEP